MKVTEQFIVSTSRKPMVVSDEKTRVIERLRICDLTGRTIALVNFDQRAVWLFDDNAMLEWDERPPAESDAEYT